MNKIIYLLIFTLLANIALVSAYSHLDINKVDITTGGDSLLSTTSDTGTIKAEAGQDIRVKIRLENTYSESTNNDITDVDVVATLEGIDDGSDVTDSTTTDVLAGTERSVTLSLEIPDDASADQTYYLRITADGKDNTTSQSDKKTYELEITKEKGRIEITELNVNDGDCSEDTTMHISIENSGRDSEAIDLEVTSDFGTIFTDSFDLDGIDDTDNTYSESERIDLSGIGDGTYEVTAVARYNDQEVEETTEFTVTCHRETMQQNDIYNEPEYVAPIRSAADRSFLYNTGEQPVDVVLPPQIPTFDSPKPAPQQTSTLTYVALFFANIAILVFIILLAMPLYDTYKNK